jgi:hypothetical protein
MDKRNYGIKLWRGLTTVPHRRGASRLGGQVFMVRKIFFSNGFQANDRAEQVKRDVGQHTKAIINKIMHLPVDPIFQYW